MTPEGKIKAKINKALKTVGPIFKYMPVPTGFGRATLDYLLCYRRGFVAVEAKKDAASELTPRQMITINELLAAGARVFVVYDQASLEEMINEMKFVSPGAYPPIPVNEKNPAWQVRKHLLEYLG